MENTDTTMAIVVEARLITETPQGSILHFHGSVGQPILAVAMARRAI
jgi:hypothetical protein